MKSQNGEKWRELKRRVWMKWQGHTHTQWKKEKKKSDEIGAIRTTRSQLDYCRNNETKRQKQMRTKKSAQNRCICIFIKNIFIYVHCAWMKKNKNGSNSLNFTTKIPFQYLSLYPVEKCPKNHGARVLRFFFELEKTTVPLSFSFNHFYIYYINRTDKPTEGYNTLVTTQTTTDISASLNHLQTFIFSRVCLLFLLLLALSIFFLPNVFYLFVFGWWVCSCSFLLPSCSFSLSRCAFFIYVICSCYIWLPLTSNGKLVVLLFFGVEAAK